MNGIGQGQYVGGEYVPASGMTEYNRKLMLFNLAKQLHPVPADIAAVLADAEKIEQYLLGNK